MSVPTEDPADYRSLALINSDLSVNQYLDASKSESSKKAVVGIKTIFNQTMDSLNHMDKNNQYKHLEDMTMEELPAGLAKFFMVCTKKDGSCFNASSLNTHYLSMVRFLKLRDSEPVDIQTDVRFSKIKEVIKARCVESVKSGNGAGKHASQSLNADELKQIMNSPGMSRENPKGLIALTHYTVMTGLGARARQECRDMKNSDLIHGPKSSVEGLPEYITLNERLTKTRRGGKGQTRELPGRVFLDLEYPNLCPVRTLILYQSKKTVEQLSPDYPFFLTVKQSALKSPEKELYWYSSSPMGINYIGKLFTDAIKASNIDVGAKKITATSARKNLAQVGASANVPSALLSKLLGQNNIDSKVSYVSNTDKTQKAASLAIARGVRGQDNQDFSSIYKDVKTTNSEAEPDDISNGNFELTLPDLAEHDQTVQEFLVQSDGSLQPVIQDQTVQSDSSLQPVNKDQTPPGPSNQNGAQTPPGPSNQYGAQIPPGPPNQYGAQTPPGPSHQYGAQSNWVSDPQYPPYQPHPPHNFGYCQPPQHYGYHQQPYFGYPAYPPYQPPYMPPPPPPPTYYPPPQYHQPQYNQSQYHQPQYHQPKNQLSLNQYNYSFNQGPSFPDCNQTIGNENRKRALTDISNLFPIKKPKI